MIQNQAAEICQTAEKILEERSEVRKMANSAPPNVPSDCVTLSVKTYIVVQTKTKLTIIAYNTTQENKE